MSWQSPSDYHQFAHPWHWITYGQNASGLGAVSSLLAAGAASIAGYFAFRAYQTTVQQLGVATKQYWDGHKMYLESVRPHLVVRAEGKRPSEISVPFCTLLKVKNVGSGRAINIEGKNGIVFSAFSLAAGYEGDAAVEFVTGHAAGRGYGTFLLYYSSVDGRRFRAETTIRDFNFILNEEEVDISAGVEPPTFGEPTVERHSLKSDKE
jgi:hypothetical protein